MLLGLIKAMRPHQWVKNLFVLAPLIFAKELFDPQMAMRTGLAFLFYSLLASSVYLMNDLADVEADRAHPVKRGRPIASGRVPVNAARAAAAVLVVTALGGGFLLINPLFVAAAASYFVLNIGYTLGLKKIAYVDVLCIALGFELRVLAGSFAAQVPPSTYLLVVTFLLALFLGLGKRMHELMQGKADAAKQRKALEGYAEKPLTVLLFLTACATIAIYAIYTLDPGTRAAFGTNYLVGSSIFTIFGVVRFFQLVRGAAHAESPTEEMLKDRPFLLNLVCWAAAIMVLIYWT